MLNLLTTRIPLILLILLGLVFSTSQIACSCREELTAEEKKKKEEEEEEKKKKADKEKPKVDFEFRDTRTIPTEVVSSTPRNGIKPGHWTTVGVTVVANNFDFQGELHTQAVTDNATYVEPLDIDHTNFYFLAQRPAPLPRGQAKRLLRGHQAARADSHRRGFDYLDVGAISERACLGSGEQNSSPSSR